MLGCSSAVRLYFRAMKETDVLIIGGGPAGSACALLLSDAGIPVTILDKSAFPRDKICGDALSPDVINQLVRIRPSLRERFNQQGDRRKITGLRLVAPSGEHFELYLNKGQDQEIEGFVMPRMEFDRTLNEEVQTAANVQLLENVKVTAVEQVAGGVLVKTSSGDWKAKMIVGADGAHSIVAKQLAGFEMDREHYCAALRVYYENVSWDQEGDLIELHFLPEVSPGYLWVFPMEGNKANVGIGMLSKFVAEKNVNLRKELDKALASHPVLAPRFENARPMESVKGFGIPLGSKKFPLSGAHFLLVGDAASLVDPMTGEGVGNALRSGRFAAEHIIKALQLQRFDAAFNKAYDKRIYKAMWSELRISRAFQKFFTSPNRVNKLTRFLKKNQKMHQKLNKWFLQDHLMTHWNKPSFYFKKLFGLS